MLFRKYQIVIFKDNEGICRKLRLRGWMGLCIFGLVLVLIGGNVFFWNHFNKFQRLENNLIGSEKTVHEQKTQLLHLANKIKTLEKDLLRIRDFDSKLRVMINLDQERRMGSPIGGAETMDFSESYLPLHRQELLARKMHNFLHQLNTEARLEEVRQQELVHAIRANQDLLAATPSIWPTKGWVSSRFGYRTSPFTGKREFHKGLDISAPKGTPIYAPAKGKISFVGKDGGYGMTLVISHGSGMITRYGHLHSSAVKIRQTVTRGELIAYIGNTGRSTGPHLHYEVRLNGVPVNPMRYVLN
ncbi:MAG: M23 family metallopeptidase [Thermodesulfobacteriota bacterium]|nr:M23 family metallopeptidase [Thermodesulfobacteriota bacterium]